MKMCLEGVEWCLDDKQIDRDGKELVGPNFYIRGAYHLQLEGRKEENQVLFRVCRVKLFIKLDVFLYTGSISVSI